MQALYDSVAVNEAEQTRDLLRELLPEYRPTDYPRTPASQRPAPRAVPGRVLMTDGQLCTAGETVTPSPRASERWFGMLGQAAGGAMQPVGGAVQPVGGAVQPVGGAEQPVGSAVEPTVLVEISQQRTAFPLTGLRFW